MLPQDERVDVKRAGVVGRSYGGYMTLTLAARHPELWRAAGDMFGPYDLVTFGSASRQTWKPFFELALGHPEKDRDFLVERSPRTYIDDITCPLLVIQGKNDPRVVEQESHDLVERLRGQGREVDYLVFEDEGHDVLKLPNRVRCYEAIGSSSPGTSLPSARGSLSSARWADPGRGPSRAPAPRRRVGRGRRRAAGEHAAAPRRRDGNHGRRPRSAARPPSRWR